MRIPIPESFTARQTMAFAVGLPAVQLLEGTDLAFALLTFAYIILFALAYNVAGGIHYPSGAWVLFTGLESALIGLTYKALLVQPGQSNLREPTQTMLVYCMGMAGMGLAAWASRALRTKRGLLAGISAGETMKESSVGCLVVGIFLSILTNASNASHEAASLDSALNQLNHFLQLAILLGTVYEIQRSGGKRSTNWVVWMAGAYMFGAGLLSFSKEGMFIPVATWLIPTIILRFNFSKLQVVGGVLAAVFTLYYLVPYSQAGRASRDKEGVLANNYEAALGYLTDLQGTRALYLDSGDTENISDIPHLYNRQEGLFDRIQMLAFDDALIAATDDGSVFGLAPTLGTFLNTIPRFIWKDKPEYKVGNDYGREIGVIAEDDESTGISFSPTADAYHEAKWFGVIVVETLIMFILFLVTDSLSGDVRVAPWGLLFVATAVHFAPEGGLPGPIWLATYGSEGVIVAALFSGYVMPVLAKMFTIRSKGSLAGGGGRFVMNASPRRLREAAAAKAAGSSIL